MRAVLQRVRHARVTTAEGPAAQIGPGLLVLLGVAAGDTAADVEFIATKVRELRVFADDEGRMNRSVMDVGGEVLVVSQFTLLADCRKGRRPSFDPAADAATARELYGDVVGRLRTAGLTVATGVFQADMDVESVNNGPVTLLLDSRRAV
jgi:D-tyrosyl-tRNA(Tyr) deacylase